MINIPTTIIEMPVAPMPSPQSFSFPTPVSYEFRVMEYTELGKVTKVRLEYKVVYHNQYGNNTHDSGWQEVPRITHALDKDPN